MPQDLIIIIIACAIGLPILIFMIIRSTRFKKTTDDIKIGMSFSDTINILGEPNNKSVNGDIMTCTWTIHGVPRLGIVKYTSYTRVVTFKDNKVISVTNSD